MTERRIDADTCDAVHGIDLAARPVPFDVDHGFDDGLVHDHGWACRERGAPAY